MESNTSGYTERFRTEIERFRVVENVHDLPAIFRVWANKYVLPKVKDVCGFSISEMEEFYATYIGRYAAENPSEEVRIASIGAGNGDLEVRIAALLKSSGLGHFRFQCVDINPSMLDRGREAVSKAKMTEHFEFIETDVSQWSPNRLLGIVIAHHSLHHIDELENTFAKIRSAIGRNGYFLACDMIGRNGHMRWPEALEIIHDIWRKMPDRYKYNHQLKRFEEVYENWDCSTDSFEGIRAQDILPLLVQIFRFETFVAFGNLPDIFVDRSFGHNFSPENEEDIAFIDRIGQLNDRLISEEKIKPTQMIAVMRAADPGPCKCYLHWTPEFCVRHSRQPFAPADSAAVEGFLQIPLTGCAIQLGRARGFWPDSWIATSFDVTIRVNRDVESIVVDGYLPQEAQHDPELCVSLNGTEIVRQRPSSGLFSLHVRSPISGGRLVTMKITADKSYCPARAGDGGDERELAVVLREIRAIPREGGTRGLTPLSPFQRASSV